MQLMREEKVLTIKEKINLFKLIDKKPITPTEKETNENPSSRSAKLRYVVKKKIFMILKLMF